MVMCKLIVKSTCGLPNAAVTAKTFLVHLTILLLVARSDLFLSSGILSFHLSFNEAHNFKGVKCGPRLPFLCAVWKFHKNPIKPRFICAASSSFLTDVSK
jgi:hypothetical protein